MQSEIQKSGTEVFPHALNYGHGGISVFTRLVFRKLFCNFVLGTRY